MGGIFEGEQIQPQWVGPPGAGGLASQLSSLLGQQLGGGAGAYNQAMDIYGGAIPGLFGQGGQGGQGGLWGQSQQNLQDVIGGKYLSPQGNPYTQGLLDYQRQRSNEQAVGGRQQLKDYFARAGHQWSTPAAGQLGEYERNLNMDIGGREAQTLSNIYGQERQNQMSAMGQGLQLPWNVLGNYSNLGQQPLTNAMAMVNQGQNMIPQYQPSIFEQVAGAAGQYFGGQGLGGASGGNSQFQSWPGGYQPTPTWQPGLDYLAPQQQNQQPWYQPW